MQYSPKLKSAMEEIKAILNKNDIAGVILLHTPGFGEHLVKVAPSYSCAQIQGEEIRIKCKLQEDCNGDRDIQERRLTDTSNMLSTLTEMGGPIIVGLMGASEMLDKHIDAKHTRGPGSSHISQNN